MVADSGLRDRLNSKHDLADEEKVDLSVTVALASRHLRLLRLTVMRLCCRNIQ
jgi:hypothetical protein